MTTFELVNLILNCKNRYHIKKLLNKHRISVKDSKYC